MAEQKVTVEQGQKSLQVNKSDLTYFKSLGWSEKKPEPVSKSAEKK